MVDKNLYYVFNLFIVLDKYNKGTFRIKYYLFINLYYKYCQLLLKNKNILVISVFYDITTVISL